MPDEELKRRLRVVALWSGYGQRELATLLEVEYGTLRNWFTDGRTAPPLEKVLRIADVAGVPRDFVLDGWGAISDPPLPPSVEHRLSGMEQQLRQLLSRDLET